MSTYRQILGAKTRTFSAPRDDTARASCGNGAKRKLLSLNGITNSDIARILDITHRTAKAHVAAILEKLGASDRAGAVAKGFERGFLKI